jgi:hypothetical protein
MNSEFTGRENLREDSTAIKEKIRYESEHSDPVNVNPVAPADGTVTVVDTVAPPAPVVHYYEFSRGSPRN